MRTAGWHQVADAQTLRRRPILISDELWGKIEKAAEHESEIRGETVPPEDWICDQLESAVFFISWNELGEGAN